MLILVTDRTETLAETTKQHAERRLRFALSRFDGRIVRIDLTIGSPLDPPNDPGRSMRLTIKLRGADDVILADHDVQLQRCVSRLSERAARDVRRAIDRAKFFTPINDRSPAGRGTL